jgi:hypothetical protein
MRNHFISRNAAAFAAGGFVAALFLAGAAHAITDTIFKYSTPKAGSYGLSPLGFIPGDNTIADGYAFVIAGGFQSLQLFNGHTFGCFETGVNLPQGATISGLTMWYSTDTNVGVGTSLVRAKLSDGTDDVLATINSINTNQLRKSQTTTVSNSAIATVNNNQYVYTVSVCLSSPNLLSRYFAGRISYTYTTAGD